ncbi:MAG TPA: phytanoyl-CoA dioxygenase family protein [Burkholderiales bacterium]|nr:phytanoyl-CoA dioxygenase family protein [Burkholderiales bacterium]
MERLVAPWYLLHDFRRCLADESHQCRRETYGLVRSLYVRSHGASRRMLRGLYRRLRPVHPDLATFEPQRLLELRRDGITVWPGFLDGGTVAALRAYFEPRPSRPVGKDFVRGAPVRVEQADGTPRLAYESEEVLRAPGVLELLADRSIQNLAAAYLGCEPIFTAANAWWSLADPAADDEALSWAAQLFHFDYDWPAFVKFFFYLSDVGDADGPFTYVQGTHERKQEWRDGRVDDRAIREAYGDRVRAITGRAGDLIVADTAGYHKGARVAAGPRLMLQLEFCVARLGAGFQYPRFARSQRPRSDFRHTFDIFCESR